jgi:hypothetical protein
MKTCSLVWAAAGVATAIAANAVWAQAYPSKLVKIIVPTSPVAETMSWRASSANG